MENHHHNPAQAVVSVADVNERRLEKHRPVALALRGGVATGADVVLALAYEQVALWERGNLCSQDYIDAWKELLLHPLQAAQILEERSPRAAALRQNSPFVASVRKFQTLADAT
ncbi:hypothetical protein [Pseudoduganella violacea]|uniref:Uncharacterized protein n=1 Tax=Pseudoduganella violacea TaxID=1715466 RepID=A0A7W5FVY2_9BURK|nr:hypothetical protein [Pseudoduganella violacea]MBB3120683.1 hypothetical protein [Pseudoduganella violacea]